MGNECKNIGHADICSLIAEKAAYKQYHNFIKGDIERIVKSKDNAVKENEKKIERLQDYVLEVKVGRFFIPATLVIFAAAIGFAYYLILNN